MLSVNSLNKIREDKFVLLFFLHSLNISSEQDMEIVKSKKSIASIT